MNCLEKMRSLFPDFAVELKTAISETKVYQPFLLEIWYSFDQEQNFKALGKRIDRIIWGRKSDLEKLDLLNLAIIDFNCCLQRLRNNNHPDANLEPLYRLYDELVNMMPENFAVQLTIEYKKF